MLYVGTYDFDENNKKNSFLFKMFIRNTSWEQDSIKDRHDLRSKCNQQKSKCSKPQQSWGAWGCSEPLSMGFRGQSPLRKFLGSKEHLDWLKTDLNAA